jgi:hypothetical protein
MLKSPASGKAQIALEFLIVYSFVLIVFILIFSVITTQRAASLGQEQYSTLQLQAQNIASYIDQAAQAGSGYTATVPLISGLSHNYYNLSISTTGVVIASTQIGPQPIIAYGFSHAKSYVINGTLQESGNGISIYQISTFKGTITVSNVKGTIYINEVPPSLTSLVEGGVVTQQANVKAAVLNGQNSYISLGNNAILSPEAGASGVMTLCMWYDYPSLNVYGPLIKGAGAFSIGNDWEYTLDPGITGESSPTQGFTVWTQTGIPIAHYASSSALNINTWYFSCFTYNYPAGQAFYYLNGTQYTATFNKGSGPASAGTGNLILGAGEQSSLIDGLSNVESANLQIYNSVLSANQIRLLYLEGIGGAPINTQKLVGWWPLDGNLNDYTGYGNGGAPINNPGYQSVDQINAQVFSLGNSISNVPVGFVASNGVMSSDGESGTFKTNSNGLASAFLTSNGALGSTNVSTDIFNGNLSSASNLIGWWPLDSGYGTNVFDLSQNSVKGTFTGNWRPSVNETNFVAATFPGGGSSKGFVEINSSQSLLGIVNNNTFTLVAWVYYDGPTGHSQGIFGDWPGANRGGFQFVGDCSGCPNGAVLDINQSSLSFPAGDDSVPSGTWEMVTAQYDGYTGLTTVYINNTVFASNILPKNLGLVQPLPYYIGNDADQPSGLDTFDGMITNVQFYDSYLTKQQIDSLYNSGIGSTPLGNGGLIGWWPLLNNTRDYSNNQNNGVSNGMVTYLNSNLNDTEIGGPLYPAFATQKATIPYNSDLNVVGPFSVTFWFTSFKSSTVPFDSDLVDANKPNHGFDLQLCGGNACGYTGFNGMVGVSASAFSMDAKFNFSQNTWYSVTETFSPTKWTIYLDGNPVNSGPYSGAPNFIGAGDTLTIGGPGVGSNFDGQIADLQLYNSELTAQQAQQLYTEGLPNHYVTNVSLG